MNSLQFAVFFIAIAMAHGYGKGNTSGKKVRMVRARAIIAPNTKPIYPQEVSGGVNMTQKATGGAVLFSVRLEGFLPNTYHGFHVHQLGDIHTKGCGSAGGHYNPFGRTHGGPDDRIRHVGDLGNLKADENGKVHVRFMDSTASLVGKNSIAGRAFVVHQKRDDLGRGTGVAREESLKTGNAGARVACGIIFYV